jgi:signal transduction histidine kinase
MRALIAQLRPPALTRQGLVAALQQHVATLSRREGLRVELKVTGDERAAQGTEQALYRIVQEALNNVLKHARATSVRVQLEFDAAQVQISVADDGSGFDPAAAPAGAGRSLGLISMRERAAEIGGTLTIHSTPGSGTIVRVVVPRAART